MLRGIVTHVGAGNFKAGVSRVVRNAVTAQEYLSSSSSVVFLRVASNLSSDFQFNMEQSVYEGVTASFFKCSMKTCKETSSVNTGAPLSPLVR